MIFKSILLIAAIALVNAEEPATCPVPAVRYNTTAIVDASNFCTMLPASGVQDVATYEACALSYCMGSDFDALKGTADFPIGTLPMPTGFIKSAHFVQNDTNNFVQITGCMDSSVLKLNASDEGGQMDSHGWQYKCHGYKKFLSLVEPATNTYCIRCCNGTDVDVDCDTSHSTSGCWNLIPGLYTLSDNSTSCPLPANSTTTTTVVSSTAAATGTGATSTASGSSAATTTAGSSTSSSKSAGARISMSLEFAGLVAAAAMGIAAAF
ncbi:hypothetical protein EDD21DRAFT_411153 [Dissophora ornata]|nr:hypothetical protein BGZ58_005988 [Dissophora ornata]KAI8605402.1 hypothetical protein EDD21DRAFT_411153 [Dissophora ornata]